MKIFAAGDFHGDKAHAQKLADSIKGEDVDAIVLNGDIVEEHDIEGVVGVFAALGKPVLLVPGNHESEATTAFLAARYGAVNLHKYGKRFDTVGFVGVGGAEVGVTVTSDSEMYKEVVKNFQQIGDVKKSILVSHHHPRYTAMEQMSQFVTGSLGLRKAIENVKPDIVICGHVHEAAGLEEKIGKTRVINVGREGKIIDV